MTFLSPGIDCISLMHDGEKDVSEELVEIRYRDLPRA